MGTIALQIPQSGQLNSTEDPKVASDFNTLQTLLNGNVDTNNLSPTANIAGSQLSSTAGITGSQLAANAGITQAQLAASTGHSNIATSESRTNTAYGTLTTPDQVTGVVLPANGLIQVRYQATWQESVDDAARAAIFVGANQLKVAQAGAAPATEAATTGSGGLGGGINVPLVSAPFGLISTFPTSGSSSADVATGQAVGLFQSANPAPIVELGGSNVTIQANVNGAHQFEGGICTIFAAAGTYTISVQFKALSGSVTASNRKLWVSALSFS